MRTERDRDEQGYVEAQVIWEGALDEIRFFTPNGEPLDENQLTLEAWVDALEATARADDADVEVYIVEHGHPVELPEDERCACWLDVPDGRPYWASRETDER